jgi:hypothetical protein
MFEEFIAFPFLLVHDCNPSGNTWNKSAAFATRKTPCLQTLSRGVEFSGSRRTAPFAHGNKSKVAAANNPAFENGPQSRYQMVCL